jgi:hypothetical protein
LPLQIARGDYGIVAITGRTGVRQQSDAGSSPG